MHRLAIFITDFGDSAVTVSLAVVTMAILLLLHRPRLALGWSVCVAGCGGVMLALKLILAGDVSPSGHAAMGTVVYAGFVALIGRSLATLERRAAALGAFALVAAIAVSRVVLHEHSVAETLIGLAVGLAALGALRAVLTVVPAGRLPAVWLCLAALVTVALMHGTRWHTEGMIHRMAGLGPLHG